MNDIVNVYMACAEWNGINNKLWQRQLHLKRNNIASARGPHSRYVRGMECGVIPTKSNSSQIHSAGQFDNHDEPKIDIIFLLVC
jgi:hypothetical protein